MRSRTEDTASKRRARSSARVIRRSTDSVGAASSETYRDARQLELYVHMLRILVRNLAEHRAAGRPEAARETHASLQAARVLIRRLCEDGGFELPPEVSPED